MPQPELPSKIYPDSDIHYLDFAAYPLWINILYEMQKNSRGVHQIADKLLANTNPKNGLASRLHSIQQFIHDDTYHVSAEDRIKLYGYVANDSIPYSSDLLTRAYQTIDDALVARGKPEARERVRKNMELQRFVGSKNAAIEKSLELQDQFRGKPPLQCAEEATLAAALSSHIANISNDRIVLFGSPVHVATFIRPSKEIPKGCLFDSKMLYFPKDMKRFGATPQERKSKYTSLFGRIWFLVNNQNAINLDNPAQNFDTTARDTIVREIDNFFGI